MKNDKTHTSKYVARKVDAQGYANYTDEENQTWHDLITRQIPIVEKYACEEYLTGLKHLNLPHDHVPQCPEITQVLQATTGWSLQPVAALISYDEFFSLLANYKFPAATFIRRHEELDYLQEPDIFHETFGHCPLLTNQAIADFTHTYGKLSLTATPEDRVMLARLYWFTIEFGLKRASNNAMKVYGGGILSSYEETPYSIDSKIALRKPFDVLEILRTPYRIDIKQPIYYVIDDFNILFHLIDQDLFALISEARRLGMHQPLYV